MEGRKHFHEKKHTKRAENRTKNNPNGWRNN